METQVTLTMTVSQSAAKSILAALETTGGATSSTTTRTQTTAKKPSGKVTKAQAEETEFEYDDLADESANAHFNEDDTDDVENFEDDEETEVNISDDEVRAAMNKITQKQGVKGLDKYLTKLCKVKARPKVKDITQEQRQAVVKFAGTLK